MLHQKYCLLTKYLSAEQLFTVAEDLLLPGSLNREMNRCFEYLVIFLFPAVTKSPFVTVLSITADFQTEQL